MKTTPIHRITLTLAAAWLLAPALQAQGPLMPTGAPAATMKTLAQIEPRTPISALPFLITQPVSYYLTANLECSIPGTNGITVAASRVTIDLRGFSIINRAPLPTGSGIRQFAPACGLSVCNGMIENWRDPGEAGLRADGPGAQATDVAARYNGDGLSVASAARVERCTALNNASQGIIAASGAVVRACCASGNANGVTVGPDSLVENVVIVANNHGMYAYRGSLVRGCVVASNAYDGVYLVEGGLICDCVLEGNGEDGIELGATCTARDNHCRANGRTGINVLYAGNTLDGNTVVDNGVNLGYPSGRTGILVNGAGNLIVRNRLSSNQTTEVNIASGNVVGTVMPPAPTATPIIGNAGGGFGTTDPFANVVY